MGFYGDRVLPYLVDRALGVRSLDEVRARVCAGLCGEVVEIGFGSGLNVAHYPDAVRGVAAVEPSDVAWRLAGPRIAASRVPVRRAGLDGQQLPFPDGSFDAALSSFTLCTVPDAPRALAELRRVLRPRGTLHLVEHGRAPDESVRRWQRRLGPLQLRLAGGCHVDRPVDLLLAEAGFRTVSLSTGYLAGSPRALSYLYEGSFRVP